MAITSEAAQQAVRAAVSTADGASRDVWIGQSNAVRGATAYYTVQRVSDVQLGYPVESRPSDVYTVKDVRQVRFQITGFGEETYEPLCRLASLVLVPGSALGAAIRTAGVLPQRATGPRNVSALYRSGTMPQYVLDLAVQYTRADTPDLGTDDATGITVDLHERGGGDIDWEPAVVVPEV